MRSDSSTDNPFNTWERLNNDSLLSPVAGVSVFAGLGFLAATIHAFPWLQAVYPLCLQMWRDPLKRLLSLKSRFSENRSLPNGPWRAFLVSEIAYLLLSPFLLLFPMFVYVGLPVSAVYGTPLPFFQDAAPRQLGVYAIFLWIATLHVLDTIAHVYRHAKSVHQVFHIRRLGLLMAFFGALCLTAYHGELARVKDTIQYVGPVRLSNIAMYYDDMSGKNPSNNAMADGEDNYPYVYASWTAEWGSTWACPAADDAQWCQVRQKSCQHTACYQAECSQSEIDLSMMFTRECLNKISLHWSDAAFDSDHSFDPHVSPRDDRHWPSILAYANCQTCEIYGDTQTGYSKGEALLQDLPYAESLHLFGLSLCFAGWFGVLLALASGLVRRQNQDAFVSVATTEQGAVEGDLELEEVDNRPGESA
jgi:hypothetical protein